MAAVPQLQGNPPTTLRSQPIDDWLWRCAVPAGTEVKTDRVDAAPCEIAQSVKVQQDGRTAEILGLAISRSGGTDTNAQWVLTALVPLDVHLASDFGLEADGERVSLARYRNCTRAGCFVVAPLDASSVAKFKKAAKGAALFRLINGQVVRVVFSLKGFARALDQLASGKLPDAVASARPAAAPKAAP